MNTLKTAAVLLCFAAAAPTLRGQMSLSLSPVHMEFILAAGNSEERMLTVGNDSPEDVRVRARIIAWAPGPAVPPDVPAAEGASLSSKDWLAVIAGDFRIPARQSLDIPVIAAVPQGAGPGQYPAVIAVQSVSDEAGEGLHLQGSLTALAVITVGKARDDETSEEIAVERRDGQAFLVLRRKNSGRFFAPTEGTFLLRDEQGKKAWEAEFFDNPVPPLSEGIYRIPLDAGLAGGRYEAECVLYRLAGKKTSLKKAVLVE